MLDRPSIRRWTAADAAATTYDVAIGALGFEQRATAFFSAHCIQARDKLAWAFDTRQVLAFKDNLRWYRQHGFNVEQGSEASFREWSRASLLECARRSDAPFKVLVDISSLSRARLAAIVASCAHPTFSRPMLIDFAYSLAEFSEPPQKAAPIKDFGPVLPEFAGWWTDLDKPLVAIFGLGYEHEMAIGVVEYLEPAELWAFQPSRHDERYTTALDKANASFFRQLPRRNLLKYPVDDPFECIALLESLVHGVLLGGRPILIPFGPKVFSLSCILLGCLLHPDISVWRVSAGHFGAPVDRVSNGRFVGLRACFGSQ